MSTNFQRIPNFPAGNELKELLKLDVQADLDDIFVKSLTGPLLELFARPRKELRGSIVHLGFDAVAWQISDTASRTRLRKECDQAALVLETLHAGSLVVDDIEDGSAFRRGRESLHTAYGLPVALNAGNWLYFLPLKYLEALEVSEECQSRLIKGYHHTLLLAHYGQAIDVGIPVDSLAQEKVYDVAMASMELKSGVLSGYALQLGGIIAGADDSIADRLDHWGRRLGRSLQMFDDLGNITSSDDPGKRLEDLRLNKPGYIFALSSKILGRNHYDELLRLTKALPESESQLEEFLSDHALLQSARDRAESFLDEAVKGFHQEFNLDPDALNRLHSIQKKLVSSYG